MVVSALSGWLRNLAQIRQKKKVCDGLGENGSLYRGCSTLPCQTRFSISSAARVCGALETLRSDAAN